MKKMHAQWLTVHKADIDQDTSIEILWHTAPSTLTLLLFRINHGASRATLTTAETGSYHCLAELHQQLCMLFGKLSAQRICYPSTWLPPDIPATHPVPPRPPTSVTPLSNPKVTQQRSVIDPRESPALTTPHRPHRAMTDGQPSQKVHHVSPHEHWTELA